jgi:hypothetical protein
MCKFPVILLCLTMFNLTLNMPLSNPYLALYLRMVYHTWLSSGLIMVSSALNVFPNIEYGSRITGGGLGARPPTNIFICIVINVLYGRQR